MFRPRSPKRAHPGVRNQRGMAMMVALLTLVAMVALALVLSTSINTNTRLTSYSMRGTKALMVAEAGVTEAMERIRAGDFPDTLNPRTVAQVFLAQPGSVPVLGADSVALPTRQPSGAWLNYSKAVRDTEVLTISYKTNANRTAIYRYNPSVTPHVQTTSGGPIFVIRSTGMSGGSKRTVVAEVTRKPIVPNLIGMIVTNSTQTKLWCGNHSHGPFMYNGMNHRADTPTGAGVWGPDPENYVGSGDVPAFWSRGPITYGGNRPFVCCDPVGDILENQPATNFYKGPWECLSMSQADFYQWAGTPRTTLPPSYKGITYLDNNSIGQDAKGSWTASGVTGEGLLYCDGDLTINGDFTWRGIVYTEGTLVIKGNMWVLGSIAVADPGSFHIAHLRCTYLYSADAISQTLMSVSTGMYQLSWREY